MKKRLSTILLVVLVLIAASVSLIACAGLNPGGYTSNRIEAYMGMNEYKFDYDKVPAELGEEFIAGMKYADLNDVTVTLKDDDSTEYNLGENITADPSLYEIKMDVDHKNSELKMEILDKTDETRKLVLKFKFVA